MSDKKSFRPLQASQHTEPANLLGLRAGPARTSVSAQIKPRRNRNGKTSPAQYLLDLITALLHRGAQQPSPALFFFPAASHRREMAARPWGLRGFVPREDAPLHDAFSSSSRLLRTKLHPSPSAAVRKTTAFLPEPRPCRSVH